MRSYAADGFLLIPYQVATFACPLTGVERSYQGLHTRPELFPDMEVAVPVGRRSQARASRGRIVGRPRRRPPRRTLRSGRRHVENLLIQVELIREAYKITRVSGWTDERQEALETWREIYAA